MGSTPNASSYELHGLAQPASLEHMMPMDLPEGYAQTMSRLIMHQGEGVTHFYGAELDLGDRRKVWMSPVEVDDGDNFSYFQLLYVNTTPTESVGSKTPHIYLLEIDETSFKLANEAHPSHRALDHLLSGDEPKILIRYCRSGMAYFPRSVVPNQENDIKTEHLDRLTRVLGINEAEVAMMLTKVSADQPLEMPRSNEIGITHARRYAFEGSQVYTYGLTLENDPWVYYDIFTPKPLDDIERSELLVRLDSGCDIGQIYNDRGCDCREQLHTSLTSMRDVGHGMVIHVPSQDGRGFGAATKMETEGLKRGIPVVTNHGDLTPMDTIAAAKHLLGEKFDIRTYDGAGRILAGLGIRSILLQTDNKLKQAGLEEGGITVMRQATGTQGKNGSHDHVKAKLGHDKVYYSD